MESEAFSDEDLTRQIDDVLGKMDRDKDGYVSYAEFVTTNREE
jgi:Ca2+-binding EF-hand superfamily protein